MPRDLPKSLLDRAKRSVPKILYDYKVAITLLEVNPMIIQTKSVLTSKITFSTKTNTPCLNEMN